MVNFSPLAAEIGPVVWGTTANFNGFCVLSMLLHKQCYRNFSMVQTISYLVNKNQLVEYCAKNNNAVFKQIQMLNSQPYIKNSKSEEKANN